jgi:DNA polymerase-3 subunit epsilon
MSRRIQDVAQHTTQTLKTRWPLEDMLGADLVRPRRGASNSCTAAAPPAATSTPAVAEGRQLLLLQALAYLAGRLVDEYASSWSNCACRCRASAPSSTWCGSARR